MFTWETCPRRSQREQEVLPVTSLRGRPLFLLPLDMSCPARRPIRTDPDASFWWRVWTINRMWTNFLKTQREKNKTKASEHYEGGARAHLGSPPTPPLTSAMAPKPTNTESSGANSQLQNPKSSPNQWISECRSCSGGSSGGVSMLSCGDEEQKGEISQ